MAIDQDELWRCFASDCGEVSASESDQVLLEPLVLVLPRFGELDLTGLIAIVCEAIDYLLGRDESVTLATGG